MLPCPRPFAGKSDTPAGRHRLTGETACRSCCVWPCPSEPRVGNAMFAAHYRIPEDKPLGSVHTYQWERAALSPPPRLPRSRLLLVPPPPPPSLRDTGWEHARSNEAHEKLPGSAGRAGVRRESEIGTCPLFLGTTDVSYPKKLESTGAIFFRSPGWTRSFPGKIYSRRPSLLSSCPKTEVVKMVAVHELSSLLVWMEQ